MAMHVMNVNAQIAHRAMAMITVRWATAAPFGSPCSCRWCVPMHELMHAIMHEIMNVHKHAHGDFGDFLRPGQASGEAR